MKLKYEGLMVDERVQESLSKPVTFEALTCLPVRSALNLDGRRCFPGAGFPHYGATTVGSTKVIP